MEGLLAEVSTSYTRKGANDEKDDFLIEVKSEARKPQASPPLLSEAQSGSAENTLNSLKSQLSLDDLRSILRHLSDEKASSGSSLSAPSAINSQIVNVLVSETIPNYWDVLKGNETSISSIFRNADTNLLLKCLQNVSSLNAILVRLRALVRQAKDGKNGAQCTPRIKELLEVLDALLKDSSTVHEIYSSVQGLQDGLKEKMLWKELLMLLGSGRILETAAEATHVLQSASNQIEKNRWISDGVQYSQWLGRCICHWAKEISLSEDAQWKHLSELVKKAIRLGHLDVVLKEILVELIIESDDFSKFETLLQQLAIHEQKNALYSALRFMAKFQAAANYHNKMDKWWEADAAMVASSAKLIDVIVGKDETRREQLMGWITAAAGAGIGEAIAIRRVVVVVLAQTRTTMEETFEKSMQQFGEQLYINHAPTLQQEAHAQALLLLAGYIARLSPMRLSMLVRSGVHLNAVSNRLSSSSTRARFLGMVVAEALSGLVDNADKRMEFKVSEMETDEAVWYKSLVKVQDTVGSLDLLRVPTVIGMPTKHNQKQAAKPPPKIAKVASKSSSSSKIIAIEEVFDEDTDMEDSELQTYAKPDSDAEDSDEDPTLIQRNKPNAPVYIRDLISYLRDTDSYDRQKLALSTAASLIRRKANFGTEVSAHAEELATLLVGLQDKYDLANFQELRIQGMMAVLVAQPRSMGPWFCRTFFEGDYSVSQRATILTTIGLAARELAGYKDSEALLSHTTKALPTSEFPSKMLPPKLHAIYAAQTGSSTSQLTPVDNLSKQLSEIMIEPLAASVAEAASGPAVLQVQSTRNKTSRSSSAALAQQQSLPKANALLTIAGSYFFFPLSARTFLAHQSRHSRAQVILSPFLLSTLLKTLALILHAAGPACQDLPQMTSEFWDLLLVLRSRAAAELASLEALCFALLTLLQVNAMEAKDRRRLAERHGPQLVETRAWVGGMLRMLGEGEEEERVRVLAAGIMVGIEEVVDKYQRLLLGDLAMQGPVW